MPAICIVRPLIMLIFMINSNTQMSTNVISFRFLWIDKYFGRDKMFLPILLLSYLYSSTISCFFYGRSIDQEIAWVNSIAYAIRYTIQICMNIECAYTKDQLCSPFLMNISVRRLLYEVFAHMHFEIADVSIWKSLNYTWDHLDMW